MKLLQILPFLLSLSSVSLAQNFCSTTGHTGQVVKTTGNKTGKIGSVNYEIWADGGNNSADFYSDGSFSCAFNNSKDYLCRSGISFPQAKNPSELGHIKAEYKVVKQNAQNVGYSYVGVYGWTLESGISGVFEFYIVDNWLSPSRPGDWVGNQKKGDFTIDGGLYTVYKNVKGNLTQYFSLRKEARTCGTIDVSAHFAQWEKIGLKMGKISEVKVLAEAGNTSGGCTGTVEFPYAKIYIGDNAPAQSQAPAQGNNQQQAPAQGNNQQQAPTQGNAQWNQGQNQWNQGNNQWNQGQNQGQNQGSQQNAAPVANNSNCAGDWAQCGGNGFTGPTCCKTGKCVKINEYYSQCNP